MTKINDIKNWKENSKLSHEYSFDKNIDPQNIEMISPLKVEAKKLYALLSHTICKNPNGFFTFLAQNQKPMDNLIFWDFCFSYNKTVIHIWQTSMTLEARIYYPPPNFKITSFLHKNIQKYHKEIQKKLASFDTHTLYINHYKSYKQCVDYLWDEILKLDLTEPEDLKSHLVDEKNMNDYNEKLVKFIKESVKFHALGKSLILNCAFACEAYLNNLIRFSLRPIFRDFSQTFTRYMNSGFNSKIKELQLYSGLVSEVINTEDKAIKNASNLITLRNKYVHSDESSDLNKIGTLIFDRDYPLFGNKDSGYGVEWVKADLHNPDIKKVTLAYKTHEEFVDFMSKTIHAEIRDGFNLLMLQNPIGFNETLKVYSAVHSQNPATFFCQLQKKE